MTHGDIVAILAVTKKRPSAKKLPGIRTVLTQRPAGRGRPRPGGGAQSALADGGTPGVDPEPFAALGRADSIAIDPHKHGLQPYGCGCILFRDPGVGALYLVNRTASKAEEVAAEIRSRFPSVHAHAGWPESDVDLVLNSTSLGLKPGDGSPLDETKFPLRRAKAVYDMIYRPAETPLLRAAKAA